MIGHIGHIVESIDFPSKSVKEGSMACKPVLAVSQTSIWKSNYWSHFRVQGARGQNRMKSLTISGCHLVLMFKNRSNPGWSGSSKPHREPPWDVGWIHEKHLGFEIGSAFAPHKWLASVWSCLRCHFGPSWLQYGNTETRTDPGGPPFSHALKFPPDHLEEWKSGAAKVDLPVSLMHLAAWVLDGGAPCRNGYIVLLTILVCHNWLRGLYLPSLASEEMQNWYWPRMNEVMKS